MTDQYDWVEDETLTPQELMKRFEALHPRATEAPDHD